MRYAPLEVRERAEAMRSAWLAQLDEAVGAMDAEIARDARRAMAAMKRGRYSPGSVKRAMDELLSRGDSTMRLYLAEQMREAATAATRVDAIYRAWRREGMIPGGDVVTAAEAAGLIEGGAVPTIASLSLEAAAPLTGQMVRSGGKAAYTEKQRKWLPSDRVPTLSETLHRRDVHREIRAGVHRTIRESKRYELAARELIQKAPDLGAGQRVPKLLGELKQAARNLAESANDPQAKKAFNRAFRRVESYAQRIVDPATGTRALKDARGGYTELLQTIREKGPESTERALTRWTDEKQRYNADRIVETEAAGAYRAREGEQIMKSKDIVAVIWRLSHGARRGFVARTKKPKSGKSKGHRCACEALDGERMPKEAVLDFPRGAHPMCRCFFERVYSDDTTDEIPTSGIDS